MKRSMQRNLEIRVRNDIMDALSKIFESKEKIFFDGVYLKKSSLVYLFYLLETLESNNFKDKNEEIRGIHLYSNRLIEEFNPKYNKYIKFLTQNDFLIKVANHVVGRNATIYRFSDKYKNSSSYIPYQIEDITLLKKININNSGKTENSRIQNRKASRKRSHLTKHFDHCLNIDYDSCKNLMVDMTGAKRRCNDVSLFNFDKKYWSFSINKETDNRLHTLLTRLNKRFLKHVSYKNESLSEVDIKTSQPLFLFAVLNSIFNKEDHSEFKNKIQEKLGNELMKRIKEFEIEQQELANFGDIIMHKDLYSFLADNLEFKKTNGQYVRKEKRDTAPFNRVVIYNTKRDLYKKVVMQTLYSSAKNPNPEVKQVKNLFPSVFQAVDFLKSSMTGDKKISTFLQQIEAEVLLDVVGRLVVQKKSGIVLFSKHDSLITTSSNIKFLKQAMEDHLKIYLMLENVKVEINHWQ